MLNKLQQKLKNNKPIWVLNRIMNPPTTIVLTFRYNGENQTIKIPPTQYPIQLCPALVSHEVAKNDVRSLQHFVTMGALKLTSSKKAKDMLKDPEIQDEIQSLLHRTNSDAASQKWAKKQVNISEGKGDGSKKDPSAEWIEGPAAIDSDLNIIKNPMDALKSRIEQMSEGPSRAKHQMLSSAPQEVNPKVLGFMTNWTNETDEKVLNNLKTVKSLMKPVDFQYILQHCTRQCRTNNWAKENLESSGY